MKKTYFVFLFSLALFILGFSQTIAESPSILSFDAPSSLQSGQIANLSWTISGGGHTLILYCSQGIKLRYASTNAVFPCDTKISVSSAASDGVSVIVANVSGNPRMLGVKLIPKGADGVEYDAGAREISVYVNPSLQPVTDFYSNSTTTVSGVETTLLWKSNYLDGVNIKLPCDEFVTATSSSFGTGILPCGQAIFQNDLPGSGSVIFQFKNSSESERLVDAILLPAMSPGVYDGTHSSKLTLTIASDAQKPVSLSYLTASRLKIFSGDSVSMLWSYINASGVNLKIECSQYITAKYFTSSTTVPLPCDSYIWESAMSPTGSTSIAFFNSSPYDQVSTVSVFPMLKNKTYDGSKFAKINLIVQSYLKASSTPLTSGNVVITPPSVAPAPTSTQSTLSSFLGKNIFKRGLGVGSRGEDVKALQSFLSKDKTIYPEALVTGYYGPATERAFGKFQVKVGLVKDSSDLGYGFVGPKSRAFLNKMP